MKKRKVYTSIGLRLWTYFILYTLLIIAFLFICLTILSKSNTKKIEKNLANVSGQIQEEFDKCDLLNESNIEQIIREEGIQANVRVYIYNISHYTENYTDTAPTYRIASNTELSSVYTSPTWLGTATKYLNEHSNESCYIVSNDLGRNYVCFSVVDIGGQDYYMYLSYSSELMTSVYSLLNKYALLSVIGILAFAFVLSAIVSNIMTKPLDLISEDAKAVANGNYDIKISVDPKFKEYKRLVDALKFAMEEISKADKMQKDLIANVSHDFKTPLTMMKAYAAMIQEISGNDPEKRNKHAQVIIDETDRLSGLVSDVLKMSKISAGIINSELATFNVSEFTKAIVGRFSYLTESGYRFDTDIEPNLFTRAYRNEIGQVIYNLVGNAVNYTGEDKRLLISVKSIGSYIRFSVQDTGKGITPADVDKIWARYKRNSETHHRAVKGTGLGLSIVKSILEKHNFNFGIMSGERKGSTFYVDLVKTPKPLFEDQIVSTDEPINF